MSWTPTTEQLELLVSHAVGKVPAAVTAEALGGDVEDLRELADRLAQGRAAMVAPPKAEDAETTPRDMKNPYRIFR